MKDSFCYIFRFCCDPGFNDKLEIETLKRMIHDAAIDDVAVFCNVEEINTGHMSFEEQEVFLKLLEDVRKAESVLDVDTLVERALAGETWVRVKP